MTDPDFVSRRAKWLRRCFLACNKDRRLAWDELRRENERAVHAERLLKAELAAAAATHEMLDEAVSERDRLQVEVLAIAQMLEVDEYDLRSVALRISNLRADRKYLESQSANLVTEKALLQAAVDGLAAYTRHLDGCGTEIGLGKCTCGLARLIAANGEDT